MPALPWTTHAAIDRTMACAAMASRLTHAKAKSELRGLMLPSAFVFWSTPAADLPIGWDEVRRRVEAVVRSRGAVA